jgi:hypothetical protein
VRNRGVAQNARYQSPGAWLACWLAALVALATTSIAAPSAAAATTASTASATTSAATTTAASAPASPTLGRLFTTPAERAELDRRRRGEGLPVTLAPRATPTPTPPAPRVVTGIVARSDGKSTVWVNGEPRRAAPSEADRRNVGKTLGSGR